MTTVMASGDSSAGTATPGYAKLSIQSDLIPAAVLRSFPLSLTLAEFKNRLELVSGVPVNGMLLKLEDENGKQIRSFNDTSQDPQKLSELGVRSGIVIRVSEPVASSDSARGGVNEFSDVSQVEKFEISEDAYANRQDSMLTFKKQHGLGRFDESRQRELDADAQQRELQERQHISNIHVGDRCQVRIPQGLTKRGKVAHVGNTEFKPGVWIGVQYDEPVGKNDGSVDGKRYFQCPPNYGAFVRPLMVEVGDFPEIDLDAEMGEF